MLHGICKKKIGKKSAMMFCTSPREKMVHISCGDHEVVVIFFFFVRSFRNMNISERKPDVKGQDDPVTATLERVGRWWDGCRQFNRIRNLEFMQRTTCPEDKSRIKFAGRVQSMRIFNEYCDSENCRRY